LKILCVTAGLHPLIPTLYHKWHHIDLVSTRVVIMIKAWQLKVNIARWSSFVNFSGS